MHQSQRIIYIVSDIDKALAFEWVASRLNSHYDLYFILIGKTDTDLGKYLAKTGVPCFVVSDKEYPGHLRMWFRIFRLLLQVRPEVVHTHLWRATFLGLTAGWLLRVRKRVFTRHHAMVHYNEHPSGRKWDKLCNFLATDIIAISKNIRKILIERDGASPQKIHLLYHGFEFAYFDIDSPDRISELRRKYDIPTTAKPVIGIIARYMEWKGIQYAIPAFQDVLKTYPEAHLVLANAHGEYAVHIRKLLKAIPRSAYTEISYEEDLAALYRLFDVYVHVPVDSTCEAFGQTYVEALAVGIPAVFTLSGIAPEFIRDRYNALVVDYRNVDAIAQAISEILRDVQLRERLIATGRDSIGEFAAENMQRNLENIYG